MRQGFAGRKWKAEAPQQICNEEKQLHFGQPFTQACALAYNQMTSTHNSLDQQTKVLFEKLDRIGKIEK